MEKNPTEELSNEQALRNFLLDIDCLDALSPWTGKFNLFDVLKITRTEIRHSNMLAWLLDPNEVHGLGDSVLRRVVQYLVQNSDKLELDVFKTLLMDFHSFSILREWRNIDLLAVSKKEKFVLCIENKIGANEHSNQLNRYREIVNGEYPSYEVIFAFLSPDGEEPSDQDHWQALSYRDLLHIITSCREKVELLPDVNLLIANYVDTVRRDIVGDDSLMRICNEIYMKHRKALDLIYENRPDAAYQMADILKRWCASRAADGIIAFDPDSSSKTCIRFTTPTMTHILPEYSAPISGWRSNSFYYYEVMNRGDRIKVVLTICSTNLPEQQQRICNRLISLLKPHDKKPGWVWKRLNYWKWYELKDAIPEDMEEDIHKRMDQYLGDIRKFEDKLLKQWNQE